MTALLTLNIERFLALTCPYFHKRSVTKTKLVCLQSFFVIVIVGMWPLSFVNTKTLLAVQILIAVFMPLLFSLLICGNYKMFKIAKSKSADERVSPSTATSGSKLDKNVS